MAARNVLPRCTAFKLLIFNDSIGVRLRIAMHLSKKFLKNKKILFKLQVELALYKNKTRKCILANCEWAQIMKEIHGNTELILDENWTS